MIRTVPAIHAGSEARASASGAAAGYLPYLNLRQWCQKALGEMAVVVSSDNPYKNVLVDRNENRLVVVQTCQCSLWVAMKVVPCFADTSAAADTIADTAVTDTTAAAAAAAADTAVAAAAAAAVVAAAAAADTAAAGFCC